MRRHHAVFHRRRVDHAVVIVHPGDRVAVLRRRERRFVRRFTGHRHDLGRPARERVGVLCRRELHRFLAGVGRHCALRQSAGLQFCVVVVHEGDHAAFFYLEGARRRSFDRHVTSRREVGVGAFRLVVLRVVAHERAALDLDLGRACRVIRIHAVEREVAVVRSAKRRQSERAAQYLDSTKLRLRDRAAAMVAAAVDGQLRACAYVERVHARFAAVVRAVDAACRRRHRGVSVNVQRRPVRRGLQRAGHRHGVLAEVDRDRLVDHDAVSSRRLARVDGEVLQDRDGIASDRARDRRFQRRVVGRGTVLRDAGHRRANGVRIIILGFRIRVRDRIETLCAVLEIRLLSIETAGDEAGLVAPCANPRIEHAARDADILGRRTRSRDADITGEGTAGNS